MNIGIVGLGLIGGSLGLKLQSLNHIIYGVTNNNLNATKAKERNLAQFISPELKILKECSLIILALPIKDLINPSPKLIEAIPKGAIVTDVGSIKDPIIKIWENIHPLFIGSHPMAGTEQRGVNAGFKSLFDNSKWIITPTKKTNPNSLDKLSDLVTSLGCEICLSSPAIHDQAVSLISHLPIYLASSLIKTASSIDDQELIKLSFNIAASGFRDTSRVGGGNPELGIDLAKNNKVNILKALDMFKANICEIENHIQNENWDLLKKELENSKHKRNNFLSKEPIY
tara:strand:+ start:2671 stop:3525 length:855 start_codon:yes stop_codon:yes gene_type:complete